VILKSSTARLVSRLRVSIPLATAIVIATACKKPEAVALPPPVVRVIEITSSQVPLSTTLIGQLDSPQNVEVRARVEGFVDEMLFTEGTEVEQGDLLFRLDKKPFLERLAAAKGALAEAEAALNKYERDVARLRPLAAKNAIPQQDLDNALAAVDVGKAGVVTAQARVESAQIDLSYCEIAAPSSGLIGGKEVSIGDLVGKGEPTLMTTISKLDPIWFYCNVSEVEYMRAQDKSSLTGRPVESVPLTLIRPDGTEHPDPGKFVFIDRAVNPKTRTSSCVRACSRGCVWISASARKPSPCRSGHSSNCRAGHSSGWSTMKAGQASGRWPPESRRTMQSSSMRASPLARKSSSKASTRSAMA
jgi:membrane fusion protein (multidrug efflux system)